MKRISVTIRIRIVQTLSKIYAGIYHVIKAIFKSVRKRHYVHYVRTLTLLSMGGEIRRAAVHPNFILCRKTPKSLSTVSEMRTYIKQQ